MRIVMVKTPAVILEIQLRTIAMDSWASFRASDEVQA